MSDPKPALIKTCSICGQQKPLSAFMQLAGADGTTYGHVCATCRSAGKDKIITKEADDSSKSKSGHGIDAKNKLEADMHKQHDRQEIEEKYHEERDEKEEELKTHTQEEAIKTNEKQKDHRDFLSNLKYRAFLATDKKTFAQTAATQQIIENAVQKTALTEDTAKKEGAAAAEQREKSEELYGPVVDTQMGMTNKRGEGFLKRAVQLGTSSAYGRTFIQSNQKGQPAEKTGKNPLIEFADDNWKNSNTPRRNR